MSESYCPDADAAPDRWAHPVERFPEERKKKKSCALNTVSCSSVFKASRGHPIWTAGWG